MPGTGDSQPLIKPTLVLSAAETVASAVSKLMESGVRALPVADERDVFVGVFGEKEFFGALFPRYIGQLPSAAFLTAALDETIERRAHSAGDLVRDFMNTDHVDVRPTASQLQIVETFLHHRVLILPVTDDRRVVGVIDRGELFSALAGEFLGHLPAD